MRFFLALITSLLAMPALALDLNTTFSNIDGGTHRLSDWKGQPVLVVNTASLCGFTGQYDALQKLHDTYSDRGLVVLAVPSDDFSQELGTEEEVKEFCELNYDLTLPMTGITHVKGAKAHPFYKSLAQETGFTPSWNFNKVLLNPRGEVVATYGAPVKPMSRKITGQIEKLLSQTGG
ncbi:MAG: glutathione peroxidase [Pseudomonadota bacterium]